MNSSKFLVSTLMYLMLTLATSSLTAQPNFNVKNNRNGLVEYQSTGTNPNTGAFILFGNGHFSRNLNPTHYFGQSSGFTTKAFYLDPYNQGPPQARETGTGPTGTGSNTNEPYHMTTETKIETSWNATQAHDAYYVLLFKNTTSNVMNGCLNFYYKDEEILINTNGILEQTGWVSNREFLTQNNGIYNRRFRWSFSNLNPNEQRVVYISFKSKLAPPNDLNVSSSMSTNCNYVPSSLPNQSFKASLYPHDPNRKTGTECIEGPTPDPTPHLLSYTIDFQNIGTGPAQNVYIEDILPEGLNISTLNMLPAQYPYTYSINASNKLSITFPQINLPGIQQPGIDINNTKSSVSFSINTLPYTPLIRNTAIIIFDNQPAITTNTAVFYVSDSPCPNSSGGARISSNSELDGFIDLEAFPNPVDDLLNIRYASEVTQMQLFNISGQIIQTFDIDMHIREKIIDMSTLNSGIYFLRVIGQSKNKTLKVIKN